MRTRRTRFLYGIRWKMMLYFLCSAGLAVVGVAFLSAGLLLVARFNIQPFRAVLSRLYDFADFFGPLGPLGCLFLAGLTFFLVSFFCMSKSVLRGFEQISRSLEAIAGGDLDHRVPFLGRDELGVLAENVNRMTDRLRRSITKERQTQQAKDELVMSVSHDLRTPLTSILGYLDLIENDRYRDEVELRYYAQIVYAKAQRLQKMIEDLFEYTRLHAGGIRLNVATLSLGELLEQLAVEIRPMLDKAGVTCRTFPPDERILVRADGDKMVRVFENLLANAAQYGKEGQYADLAWRREGSEAVVEVINYGPPIPADDLPRIFERFYRVEKSRAEHSGGTGLGLAIAKNIVELSGGRITAYSGPDHTSFEVRLPIQENDGHARWADPAA
ncbi:MAG: HAMP domain-containing sensor histidine kinase [Bacillota bacterium]